MTSDQHKKRLIGFDLDGTLAGGYIWQSLNVLAGMSIEEDQEMVGKFYAGEMSYDEWIKLLTKKHSESGVAKEQYLTSINSHAEANIFPDAHTLISQLQDRGDEVCIVSGGIDLYVEAVAKKLGIKEWFAHCSLKFDDNDKLSQVVAYGDNETVKVTYLKKISEKLNIPMSEIIFVGDSLNDLSAFKATGNGIYIDHHNPNSDLSRAAWKQVRSLSDVQKYLIA